MPTPDPRLGYRNGGNVVTDWPTQYADSSPFAITQSPTPTTIFLDANYFAVIVPGATGLTTAQQTALLAIIGQPSAVQFGDYLGVKLNTGSPQFNNLNFGDNFVGSTLNPNLTATLDGAATATVSNSDNTTALTLNTDLLADNAAAISLGLKWLVSRTLNFFEARIQLNSIAEIITEVGFNDTLTGGAQRLAFSSHDATPVAISTNAAVIAYNNYTGGDALTQWSLVSVNAGGTPQRTATTTTVAINTWYTLSVAINAAGTVAYYINGTQIATQPNALATTAYLTPWITVKTKNTTAKIALVDYVSVGGTLT
jgi:hypothetical protein